MVWVPLESLLYRILLLAYMTLACLKVAQRRVREQALEDRQEDQKQAKETARRAAEERANELARQQVAEQDNKERMEKAAGERFEKEQELAALQAARKARELGRIPVGSKVRLTSTATLTRCLKALDAIGELVGDDGKGNMPYHVKSDAGKASWYAENDIREVFGEDASAAATQPARLAPTPLWTVSCCGSPDIPLPPHP